MTDLTAMTERQRHVMLETIEEAVRSRLPSGVEFAIIIAHPGPDQTAWISNSVDSSRDDTIRWLRECITRLEQPHA